MEKWYVIWDYRYGQVCTLNGEAIGAIVPCWIPVGFDFTYYPAFPGLSCSDLHDILDDETLVTEQGEIMKQWKGYFEKLPNLGTMYWLWHWRMEDTSQWETKELVIQTKHYCRNYKKKIHMGRSYQNGY